VIDITTNIIKIDQRKKNVTDLAMQLRAVRMSDGVTRDGLSHGTHGLLVRGFGMGSK
jgi:hypothetical protein